MRRMADGAHCWGKETETVTNDDDIFRTESNCRLSGNVAPENVVGSLSSDARHGLMIRTKSSYAALFQSPKNMPLFRLTSDVKV